MSKDLIIKGARVNNLKNISVTIPRDKMIVFTGISGCGKSSLAFDTIYAEGHRRFVESLSSYARQFLGQLDKPDVDSIEGLSPAIAIEQKTTSKNPRSTVGTITEIYDYLRLLYARIGVPHCPICNAPILPQTIDEIVDAILKFELGTRFIILAPVVSGKKGVHDKILDDAVKNGFVRARINGIIYELDSRPALDKNAKHNIEIVVDRLVLTGAEIRSRLADSLETALNLAGGIVKVFFPDAPESESISTFNINYACQEHGSSIGELEPRMFSFNNPFGACDACGGLGESFIVSEEKVIPDKTVSLFNGAINCNGFKSIEPGTYTGEKYNTLGKFHGFDIHTPLSEYSPDALRVLLYGNIGYKEAKKRAFGEPKFEGVLKLIKRRYEQSPNDESRLYYENLMDTVVCHECNGSRLKPEVLAVTVGNLNISQLCSLSIADIIKFFDSLQLSEKDASIAKEILKEIKSRLGFLKNVGLEYLTLSRKAATLSGGEAQRIRLATQIGSSLVGVLYILDEPSIGLHPRDNQKLINTLKSLRDVGNTVIVVEHDEETMLAADHIIDIGPKAGIHGGEVIFSGTPKELLECNDSITGDYLSGKKRIAIPKIRRTGNGNFITVRGASENNLKNIDVSFPLGTFTCVTGVSGSGKSSLVNSILYNAVGRLTGKFSLIPGKHKAIEGVENIDRVIAIDQSPIGRTPRSNPATYTGVFTNIRSIFASLPDSVARGYGEGRFSFNLPGGRCEACKGDGTLKIEMHFLPDVYVNCDVCKGKRYNRETLEIKYKNKTIYDILEMTVDEGCEFFKNHPSISQRLNIMREVGLGYIKIGQSSTTLSGGEAQRIKLATELSKRSTSKTLYILDEPTTGLHTDDVEKLRMVLQRLVDSGNTVIIIEHNLDIIKTADYIIDMGPEGGSDGGTVIAQGRPEKIAECETSYTGQYLKKIIERDKKWISKK